MKKWIIYWAKKLWYPLRGIKNGFIYDTSIRTEIVGGVLVLLSLYFFFGPFSALEQLLLIFCFFLMLTAEFINSAIETLLDRVHPERNESIGFAKDLAAGASMLTGLFALICLYFVLSGNL